jgi:hypothetical protein
MVGPEQQQADPLAELRDMASGPLRLLKTEGFSLWYIFDFKFEHYLTPWIIRAYWILALVLGALAMIVYTVDNVGSLFAKEAQFSAPRIGVAFDSHGPNWSSPHEQSLSAKLVEFVWRWKFTITIPLSLAMVRVFCELAIVVFNIANSLKTIERRK